MNRLYRACPLCSCVYTEAIASLDYAMWDDLALDGRAELVSCASCGMVYHQTVATENDFSRYYTDNSYYAAAETSGSGGLGADELSRYQRIYSSLAPYINNKNPRIVDIGSGKGGFLHWCKSQGFNELIAIEKSIRCADVIKQSLDIPVYPDVFALAADKQKIDIVILSHILEHVFYPVELLGTLLELANEDTLFYIEVPNAAFYVKKPNPWHYLYFEHINHFDLFHLEVLLNRIGITSLTKTEGCFLPDKGEINECCIIVAKKAISKVKNHSLDTRLSKLMQEKLNNPPDIFQQLKRSDNEENRFISIWGVSQYVQLVIAQSPILQKYLRYLVDRSPEKYGRYLNGHKIESLNILSKLGKEDVLLIPQNIYSEEIDNVLNKIKFSGKIVLF